MTTLGSFAGEINTQLGNRSDLLTYTTFPSVPNPQDTDRLMIWMKEAYTEICLGYRFEELEQSYDDVMVPNTDVYALPSECRFIRALTLYSYQPDGSLQDYPIKRRHIRNIRRYPKRQPGPPTIYAPYNPGSQPSIIVRPAPDQGYRFVWDIQVKPTFGATIAATTYVLPDDWIAVLKSLVRLKGFTALMSYDKANGEQTYLFGGYDPAVGRRMPGVIKQLTAPRDQLDIEDVEFGLQPLIRRYTNTP